MLNHENSIATICNFKNPGNEDRIRPFWFWNGDITQEGIAWQIREMKDKGLGGFFICPRQGQTVPYLSEQWFSLVRFACQYAKQQGMEAWLYDEYPYPSGMSGGEVLKQHPEAEHQILEHDSFEIDGKETIKKQFGSGIVLSAKAYPLSKNELGDTICNYEEAIDLMSNIGILQPEEVYQITGLTMYNNKRFFSYGPVNELVVELPKGSWRVEVYHQEKMGDFKFYGGYFDPCHKEAVNTFLKTTHQKYQEAFAGNLHNQVLGIFSDEVGLLSPIPWSDQIPEAFLKIKGYSILDNLQALHDKDWPNAYRIRYDLFDVAHQIFVESYHHQVANWCQQNDILYCTEVPFMRLSTQRYSSIPGGDTAHEKAGRSLEWIYDKYLRNYRYNANAVASLAQQLGSERCLIESFHSVGWTMTLQDAKWMVDRMASSGINFNVFHAFYYTIDSIKKHDAPPSQFFQNPYWKHYRLLADYVARLNAYTTATVADCRIAVLDPVPSLWALLANPFRNHEYQGEDAKEEYLCDQLRDNWVYTMKTILLHQYQYHHLDSEMLPEFVVENGKLKKAKASYEVLVVPPSYFYETSAFIKIKEFVEQGGKVIFLGNLPYLSVDWNYSDQEVAEKWQQLYENYSDRVFLIPAQGKLADAEIESEFIQKLKEMIPPMFSVEFKQQEQRKDFILAVRMDFEGHYYLSLINQGMQECECTLYNHTKLLWWMKELCMETGAENDFARLEQSMQMHLAPFESKYFCLEAYGADCGKDTDQEYLQAQVMTHLQISTKEPFQVSLQGKNVYRLAKFDFSIDQNQWEEVVPETWIEQVAQTKSLSGKNLLFSSSFGTPKQLGIQYPVQLYYKTTFFIEDEVDDIQLLLDNRAITGTYVIKINGIILQLTKGYHRFINDQQNKLWNIKQLLQKGENILEVEVCAQKDSDGLRDPLYLLGDFALTNQHTIASHMKDVYFAPDVISGYPYYSGVMKFEKNWMVQKTGMGKNILIDFDFKDACLDCLEVKVNGKSLGVRAFAPYQWECRNEDLNEGENRLELIRTNTLAAMLDGTYFDYQKHKLVEV